MRWGLATFAFLGTGGGTFLTQFSSGAYVTTSSHVVLAVGSLVLGLVAGITALGTLRVTPLHRLLRRLRRIRPRVAATVLVLVTLGTAISLVLVVVVAPLTVRGIYEWSGCPRATGFTVVTTNGQRAAMGELVDDYVRSSANANHGCPADRAYVYDVAETALSGAVSRGWGSTREDATSRRDVGPQPDVWLADSSIAVGRVERDGAAFLRPAPELVATSAVVLAIPGRAQSPLEASFPRAFDRASSAGGVVRPDPTMSTAALLATAAIYGVGPQPPHPPVLGDREVEGRLSRAAVDAEFPVGGEPDTVCHYRSIAGPRPALILSEQSVRRLNEGKPLDSLCAAPAARPSSETALRTLRPAAPRLDHRLVRFTWTSPGSPRDAAVDRFAAWLRNPEGRDSIQRAGLDPPDDGDGQVNPDARGLEEVVARHLAARQPRRDLLAVDVSGSMSEAAGDRRRYDVVIEAVSRALAAPRPSDEIGLWVFPGPGGAVPLPLVPLGPVADPFDGRTRAATVVARVAGTTPRGNTPLFRTIVDGVATLSATDSAAERRLVVVSDGEDTASALPPPAVLGLVRDRGVRVYVVTLGDITCDAQPLQELGTATGGECFDPGDTAAHLTAALGG